MMLEREVITLDITKEERQRIETLAQQHGYSTAQDYLLALVAEDAEEEVEEVDIAEALRESLRDLKEGRTYPIEKLREMLDDDD